MKKNLQVCNFCCTFAANLKKQTIMTYQCDVCGWEYDPAVGVPEAGIPAGTAWEDVPEDFVCPLCGVSKEEFSPA